MQNHPVNQVLKLYRKAGNAAFIHWLYSCCRAGCVNTVCHAVFQSNYTTVFAYDQQLRLMTSDNLQTHQSTSLTRTFPQTHCTVTEGGELQGDLFNLIILLALQ